jgi:hypothetical protein
LQSNTRGSQSFATGDNLVDDARTAALAHMSKALAHLDSDASIPSIIGAHLQGAIDALWKSSSKDPTSLNMH